MTEHVRARPAKPRSVRSMAFAENVLGALWFIPLCCTVAAMALSSLTFALDHHLALRSAADSVLPGNPASLQALASAVAAAMLTFLAVVFSTTVVAVQLASSQFSPRIARVFVRSRLTQLTLGVFVATFVFAINALVGPRPAQGAKVPAVTTSVLYLLVLTTVVMFITYIHGIVRLLRVQYLLRLVGRQSHEALDASFPPASAYVDAVLPAPGPATRELRTSGIGRRGWSDTWKVLQAVDIGGLAALAARHDCWVEVCIPVGSYAGPHTLVAVVHGADPAALTDRALHQHLLFGGERTVIQDPAFGLRQLVDAASRALSPAINDPTTGVQALQRIVDLLSRVADRPDPTGWHAAADGSARVRLLEDDFERLVLLGTTEILRYGADAPQVVRALLGACDDLEGLVSSDRLPLIATLRARCVQAVEEAMPAAFADIARCPDAMGFG